MSETTSIYLNSLTLGEKIDDQPARDIRNQVIPEGFGSYLTDILPGDIALAAGAFTASMQQIKNIIKIPIEKFAQAVVNLETTQGLDAINGTDVPADVAEVQAAYSLVALGSGPYNTYTYSDFFGCMSGLPYPWANLQALILNLQNSALAGVYTNLYAATQGPTLGLDLAVQTQIDLANAAIASILTAKPGLSGEVNNLYNQMGTQLGIEQAARNLGLAPLPSPRDPGIHPYPITIYSFIDTVAPKYAKETDPNMAAQTLEAISNLSIPAGQSIVGMMRASRNQDRLAILGIPLDDNIPDIFTPEEVIAGDPAPAYPFNVEPVSPRILVDPLTGPPTVGLIYATVVDTGTVGPVDGATSSPDSLIPNAVSSVIPGGAVVPGSLAGSPYTNLIPPALNTIDTSDVLLPAVPTVAQAIEQVINCNCDCWVQ